MNEGAEDCESSISTPFSMKKDSGPPFDKLWALPERRYKT